ncbi:Hypothetical predicted protein [Cloeon dipterum]|uniref:Uncharacterized protein n=1 Tax=Cloeon dipterum TaxID=197152 RepID=A0A8S1CFD1_9INSE|nr:Hypothetical predicted protein [Cloeon dipterum]
MGNARQQHQQALLLAERVFDSSNVLTSPEKIISALLLHNERCWSGHSGLTSNQHTAGCQIIVLILFELSSGTDEAPSQKLKVEEESALQQGQHGRSRFRALTFRKEVCGVCSLLLG